MTKMEFTPSSVHKKDLEVGMVVRTRYGQTLTVTALEDPWPDVEEAPSIGPGYFGYLRGERDEDELTLPNDRGPSFTGVSAIRNIEEIVEE